MRLRPRSTRYACEQIIAVVVLTVFALVFTLGPLQCIGAEPPMPPLPAKGYRLVFSDSFDTLDLGSRSPVQLAKSQVHTWYPGLWFNANEAELRNISAAGSVLSLTWTPTQKGADTSIATLSPDKQIFKAWRYGYFEARMRWDVVKGAWPAFWLIPLQDATRQNVYKGTRRSGEIDIFEGQGDHPQTFYGTIHEWINSSTDQVSRENQFDLPKNTDMSKFHTYALLWSPGKVTWYFDNRPLHSEETAAIFDEQDFYLVLTMQEGVDWKSGNSSGVAAHAMNLDVDWVRVWQRNP